jgi:hypothetical protein
MTKKQLYPTNKVKSMKTNIKIQILKKIQFGNKHRQNYKEL